MAQTSIRLGNPAVSNWYRIDGAGVSAQTGRVVAAGDFNGDGVVDLVIGSPGVNPNGAGSGAVHIVFGGANPPATVSMLNGVNGVTVAGEAAGDQLGNTLSVADINGDGIADLILGAVGGDAGATDAGSAYVVFGHTGPFDAVIDLAGLHGSDGFRLDATTSGDYLGWAVSGAGDVNGDGFGDFVVSAPFATPNGYASGSVYVVFGAASGFSPAIDLDALDGLTGFKVNGAGPSAKIGLEVSAAGDLNNDGIDDLLIGNSSSGGGFTATSFIVYGRDSGAGQTFAPVVELSALGVGEGFAFTGPSGPFGAPAASAGDINGDGIDDIVVAGMFGNVGKYGQGVTYVIFGRDTALSGEFASTFDAASLDGSNGFRIVGAASQDHSGGAVSSAGDFNGDGLADLAISAYGVDGAYGADAGAIYIVYGSLSGFSSVLDLALFDDSIGVRIDGDAVNHRIGTSVASAGDLNGDGFDDLVIGATSVYLNGPGSGAVYVVYGRAIRVGSAGADALLGSASDDTLSGGDGKDRLSGLDGNDTMRGDDANDVLLGGLGHDFLRGDAGNDWVQGDDGDDGLYGGDGSDKLFGNDGGDGLFGEAGIDRLEGGAGDDYLYGGDANDYLDGGSGIDTMEGNAGNDVYLVDNLADTVTEAVNEGYDVVRASVDWTLGANFEALELQGGGDIDGTGNGGANNLQGNAGSNTLSGLGGVDTINGGDGDDIIIGGAGNDLLRGGTGADGFVINYDSVFNSPLETDQIYDFSTAEGDYIDLRSMDAGSDPGRQAFQVVSAFTKHAGEITLSFGAGVTLLRLDITGDGKADYQMKINGDVTGDSAGWLL